MTTYNVYLIRLEDNKVIDILRDHVSLEEAEERVNRGSGKIDYYLNYFESGSNEDSKIKKEIYEKN